MEVVKGPDSVLEERFCQMAEAHQTALLRLCFVLLRDHALAEDAVQETFLKAYRAYAAYRGDCGEKTWLTRIAVNVCRDIKRRAWFRLVDRRVTLEQLPEPAVPFEEKDDSLFQAILQLPAREREALILYYYQDLSMAEISQALGTPLSTVGSRLKRARKRLKAMLEGGEEE